MKNIATVVAGAVALFPLALVMGGAFFVGMVTESKGRTANIVGRQLVPPLVDCVENATTVDCVEVTPTQRRRVQFVLAKG